MEIFIITAWEIWKQRNAKIFCGTTPSFQSWKQCFVSNIQLHLHRCKPELKDAFLACLNSLQ
uniref:Uncharacterized protein n=1 Tax=Arundo donax TaxID=35708 RepID=A0A0A9BPN3_ARUDO